MFMVAIYLKRWHRRWRKPVSCQCSYKKCININMRSVHTTLRFPPRLNLKCTCILNVGHQRGCKVVTSGTSVKINVFLRSLFIHCAAAELTGIFSDIMNLKDCVWFSDSLVLQQLVKTRSEGYLGHGGEGIGVKELWL